MKLVKGGLATAVSRKLKDRLAISSILIFFLLLVTDFENL